MSQSVRVAHGLVRAASAFLEVLARRPPAEATVEAPVKAPVEAPSPRPPAPETAPAPPRRATVPPPAPRPGVENRCPVCQARFRGARFCSRCGADLEPLMLLAVRAWQLRQAARQALAAGAADRALDLASAAQALQSTESGAALRLLASWLKTHGVPWARLGNP